MSRTPIRLLLVLLLGPPGMVVGRADELPPPRVRRNYGERIHMYGGASTNGEAKSLPLSRLEETPLPEQDAEPFADAPRPFEPYPGLREEGLRHSDRDAKGRLHQDAESEAKPSGWGWLADEIRKTSAGAVPPDKSQDTLLDEETRPEGVTRAEERKVTPPVESWGALGALGAERDARKPEDASAVGWRPVTETEVTGQRAVEEQRVLDEGSGFNPDRVSGFSLSMPKLPGSDANSLRGGEVDRTGRALPGDEARLTREAASESGVRSLFRPVELGAPRSSSTPLLGAPSAADEFGRFGTPTANEASGGSWNSFGSATAFGSLGAVDIQPSLSQSPPVSPALSLPSQTPATPSVGGMSRDLEVRPKTLPW